ncbi:MAG: glycoside hydrolase family 172 protein, partial [Candidatus Aminicenantaceae bacterium]
VLLPKRNQRGRFIGSLIGIRTESPHWWGEGEMKAYLDGDTKFPTICGTGTEDYFCGSYGFTVGEKYREFTTPYAGMPQVISADGQWQSQQRFGLYRWHIMDPVRFEKDLKVTMQALGWRSGGRYLPLQDDISSVAFWYQQEPHAQFPQLPSKDELEII